MIIKVSQRGCFAGNGKLMKVNDAAVNYFCLPIMLFLWEAKNEELSDYFHSSKHKSINVKIPKWISILYTKVKGLN